MDPFVLDRSSTLVKKLVYSLQIAEALHPCTAFLQQVQMYSRMKGTTS